MRKGNIQPGYEHVNVHMIFDINMGGQFTRKEILVADGHTTAPPPYITYSSVVSRESVRIAFLLAPLNDLYIFAWDIGNPYLNSKYRGKLWTESGNGFMNEEVMVMIIARALYGLKSSVTAWSIKLAETLVLIGYEPS